MKNYELLYILPASQTSEEIVKNFQDVQKHIEKFGGTMLETLLEHPFLTKSGMSKDEDPEELRVIPIVKRKLAYPIKHEKFGFYCLVNFQMEAKKLKDLDEYLRLNNQVLRHIILQADPMTKEQLEQLQTLFARKKAEQEKEEAERESSSAKEEPRKSFKKEAAPETKQSEETVEPEKAEVAEPIKEEAAPETKTEPKAEEKVEKKLATAVKAEKETEAKEAAKEEVKEDTKEEKKGRKNKIKLEELEDKLDEIFEDTIV